MSAGYAARLKDYPNKGACGLPESLDTPRALRLKILRLAELVKDANRSRRRKSKGTGDRDGRTGEGGGGVVILTGAGISTPAGIPDFRGPRGIWTLEQEAKQGKKKKKKMEEEEDDRKTSASLKRKREPSSASSSSSTTTTMDFASARPTYTHRAISALVRNGDVSYCVTQNVDGLHQRSGLSRDRLAVLHGCAFTERCDGCRAEFFRDFDIGGMSFQPTGRTCGLCGGPLRDTLLDWEDALPQADLDRATEECESADLVVCLGTSLRIEPAGSLPTKCPTYVIVNLQVTPKDEDAALIIRGRADDVMKGVIEAFGYESLVAEDVPIERVWVPKKF
jgi:mono-ADP-ribosyltransferase sirtuin 6